MARNDTLSVCLLDLFCSLRCGMQLLYTIYILLSLLCPWMKGLLFWREIHELIQGRVCRAEVCPRECGGHLLRDKNTDVVYIRI